jgi:hypothetical protein
MAEGISKDFLLKIQQQAEVLPVQSIACYQSALAQLAVLSHVLLLLGVVVKCEVQSVKQ